MTYFIGMDGGGSKTEFVLIDENGNFCARYFESTSYYLQIGFPALEQLVQNGVRKCTQIAGIDIAKIQAGFFGFPAYGEDGNVVHLLDAIPMNVLSREKYFCDNDMVCGWAGSLACEDGINIVAGTGSIAYGENKGKKARAGGLGELFSDEGSAYWIGIQGLNAFSKMADGRLVKGRLFEIFMDEFKLSNPLDICAEFLGQVPKSRDEIAAVAKKVANAAILGDEIAIRIFQNAATELCSIIDSTRKQLGFSEKDDVKLSYSGGVFQSGALIQEPLIMALSKTGIEYNFVKPRLSPAIGAAIYAAKLSDHKFSPVQLEALGKIPFE